MWAPQTSPSGAINVDSVLGSIQSLPAGLGLEPLRFSCPIAP
jgi:hypothetical protein